MKYLFSVLSLSLLLFAGCATTGQKFDASKVSQIKKGVTTRAEIETMFGQPLSSVTLGNGKCVIEYQYAEGHSTAQSFIPIVGDFAGGTKGQAQILTITLTKENIVEEFRYSTSQQESGGGHFNPHDVKNTTTSTTSGN